MIIKKMISNETVHQILHQDLNHHPLKIMVAQELLLNVCKRSNSKFFLK